MSISLARIPFQAIILAGTLRTSGDGNETEELKSEMRSLVGVQNDMKFCALVLAMRSRILGLKRNRGIKSTTPSPCLPRLPDWSSLP